MSNKMIYIFSNKFSAAHFSHLVAYYLCFIDCGFDCRLVLDKKYKDFINDNTLNLSFFFNDEDEKYDRCDLAFIYNLSKKDIFFLKKIKNYKESRIILSIHEPWRGLKKVLYNFFTKKESRKETIRIIGRKIYLDKLLRRNITLLTYSKESFELMKKYTKHKVFLSRLIFSDELFKRIELDKKKYFSFIGTASISHGFPDFINFIKKNQGKGLFFQIATSTDISNYIDNDINDMINSGELIINHSHFLSNDEINYAYYTAKCLWLFYNRSTQSGCLCKSFMFGTPVISSNVGCFGEYIDGKNGIICDKNRILESFRIIENDYESYSANARESYLNYFDYKTLKKDIENMVLLILGGYNE